MKQDPRLRLPNRRPLELLDFEHGGFRFTAGIGRFEDGGLAEIFLNCSNVGTPLLFQHSATADELRHALARNSDGSASGPLATALDLIVSPAADK